MKCMTSGSLFNSTRLSASAPVNWRRIRRSVSRKTCMSRLLPVAEVIDTSVRNSREDRNVIVTNTPRQSTSCPLVSFPDRRHVPDVSVSALLCCGGGCSYYGTLLGTSHCTPRHGCCLNVDWDDPGTAFFRKCGCCNQCLSFRSTRHVIRWHASRAVRRHL